MTPPAAKRCPTCDRNECPRHGRTFSGIMEHAAAANNCESHAVDWRARALAAEAERSAILAIVSPSSDQSLPDAVRELCEHVDDARQWRAALEGAQEPGDPVMRALAALLTCTYLDTLPTPPDDDHRRELVVAARIAHDKTRAVAARWAKVAPLIERLREAAKVARHDYAVDDDETIDPRVTGHDLIDAVANLLAATESTT